MTVKDKSKVGPITLAAGLIVGGLTLLLYNFGAVPSLEWLWKLWPVLLIGLGVEYLLKKRFDPERDVHFHVPSFLLILIMIIAGCLLYAATSLGKNINSFVDGFPWNQTRYSYSRNWESGPVEIKAGEQLTIENKTGSIRLLPAQGDELNLKATINSPEGGSARELADKINPEIKRGYGQVSIQVPDTGNNLLSGNHPVTYLEVSVPSGVNIYVKSGTGRIAAENMKANLNIDGSVGTIDLNAISGNIEVMSNTGRIRVFEPGGDLLAKNNTGSIEVSSERPLSGKYDLESNTGMVSLLLPKSSDLVINAESRTGRVSVEGLLNKTDKTGPGDEFSCQLGAGKGQANIKVGTGTIKITARQ
ncbi:MAG: hypothetical protein A4E53_02406 [Pelotomaculum sp. PtaB.Bin104]|nr:MAG: hypothetical protein A4E53_02406 [Pelotomaculum sp. PtaB.Bin104]